MNIVGKILFAMAGTFAACGVLCLFSLSRKARARDEATIEGQYALCD